MNMALSAGIWLVISYSSKKIIEAAQRVDKLAESSKEAADAATSTTSSLSELVDEYEKLGKKSDWDTDDMEQAQKIQDEILKLAKEQGTLDEDHAKKIDLQNGKYEEQLELLRDITKEQLKAAHKRKGRMVTCALTNTLCSNTIFNFNCYVVASLRTPWPLCHIMAL